MGVKMAAPEVLRSYAKELPEIPKFNERKDGAKLQKTRRQADHKVRFSLPINLLLQEAQDEELVSVVSSVQSSVKDINPKLSSVSQLPNPFVNHFAHHKNASTQSLPLYKRGHGRSKSMFPLVSNSSRDLLDTHETFVKPKDNSHFKISIPLVIMTPPKLSKVRSPGDQLLNKEMVFNGSSYEIIEVIDDDSDKAVSVSKKSSPAPEDSRSPLRNPPLTREYLSNAIQDSELSALPKASPKAPPKQLFEDEKQFKGTYSDLQQEIETELSSPVPEIVNGRSDTYSRKVHTPNMSQSRYKQGHRKSKSQQVIYLTPEPVEEHSPAKEPTFNSNTNSGDNTSNIYEQQNPYMSMNRDFKFGGVQTQGPLEYQFPSPTKIQTQQIVDLRNEQDYHFTGFEMNVPNRQKILSQSPRKHNHTRSKSSANILAEFDNLSVSQKQPQTPNKHRHSRSKSQINVLNQFDVKPKNTFSTPSSPEKNLNIYSQTGPVKEIIIPDLSDITLSKDELNKLNSKLDFYLKDQLERNKIREPAISNKESVKFALPRSHKPKRVISPIESQSSYSSHDSTFSMGKNSNSTYYTSVEPDEELMIDLTNDDQEIMITRNKMKGSISSYRNVKGKDKNGKVVDVMILDDDHNDEMSLLNQYANDFKVHDSIRRADSMASQSEELERVYSMYNKFGKTPSTRNSYPVTKGILKKPMTTVPERVLSMTSVYSTNSFQYGDENFMRVGKYNEPSAERGVNWRHSVTSTQEMRPNSNSERRER